MALLVAVFFAGVFIFAAEVDTFFTAGVWDFLGSATAAGVFFPASFFAVAVTAVPAVFGALKIALLVLALVLALVASLAAGFVFCFTIMSPLLMSKTRNPGNLLQAMILMQTLPVNTLQLLFDAGRATD